MNHTAKLVSHLMGLRTDELPEHVRTYAKVLIADAIGAGLYGRTTAVSDIVCGLASARNQRGRSLLWGRSGRLEAAGAALVNGTQAHAYELDDYHPGAKLHPGAVTVPAALAVAGEQRVPGDDLIRGVVAGYEMMIRVSLAAGSRSVRRRGWHLTGVAGPFGATAVACLLANADHDTFLHALGIAGSHAGGLFAFSASGAMTKHFHAGRAAESGIVSARLAGKGFTGPWDVLEAPDGGLLRAVSDEADPARLSDGLGDGFALAQVAIKPYPCCGSLHSSIDAVIELVTEHDLAPADIEEITALNSSVVEQQCFYPYTGDGGELEAQMNLQYCLAVAATDRTIGLEQFDAAHRADPQVRELVKRVAFEVDPEIEEIYPRAMPARLRVRTTDGRVLEHHVDGPTGSPLRPWGMPQVAAKVRGLAGDVIGQDRVDELLDRIGTLEDVDDVGALVALLEAPEGTSACGEPALPPRMWRTAPASASLP